jgi:hypothetical protein
MTISTFLLNTSLQNSKFPRCTIAQHGGRGKMSAAMHEVLQSMSRELLSPLLPPNHPHNYVTTLLIQRPTFHTLHPHRHKPLTLEATRPSPWDSLMPLPSINKHYRSHGPKSCRVYERRHLKVSHLPTATHAFTPYPLMT